MKILVIEDDRQTAQYLAKGLRQHGHVVEVADNGRDGLSLAAGETFDIMVVDRMLPGLDGLGLVKTVRGAGVKTPILMLTTLGGIDDRVEGLEAGSDDYLVKPFAFAELMARVNALARRPPIAGAEATLRIADLEMDLLRRKVRRAGAEIELTPLEFKLLTLFAGRPGRVLTRRLLIDEVWGKETAITERVVDNQIANLRKKIEPPATEPRYLRSVRGIGYRFDLEDMTES